MTALTAAVIFGKRKAGLVQTPASVTMADRTAQRKNLLAPEDLMCGLG